MERNKTTAVLLMAYGSPERVSDVEAYLQHMRGGAIAPERVKIIQDRYSLVGGKTPLLEITMAQATLLQKLLDEKSGKKYAVYAGMKHWHPFIEDTVKHIAEDAADAIVALPLAPHYSSISIGGYERALEVALQKHSFAPQVTFIKQWHTQPRLIECIVEQIRDGLKKFPAAEPVHLVFTAHSLPERIITEGDPYREQLQETCRILARNLNTNEWTFSFQSAGHTGEKWLGPDISETIETLSNQGKRSILVCPIGFVSDHLEIIYDIDIACQKLAQSLGVVLYRIESRNTNPLFIQALFDIVTA